MGELTYAGSKERRWARRRGAPTPPQPATAALNLPPVCSSKSLQGLHCFFRYRSLRCIKLFPLRSEAVVPDHTAENHVEGPQLLRSPPPQPESAARRNCAVQTHEFKTRQERWGGVRSRAVQVFRGPHETWRRLPRAPTPNIFGVFSAWKSTLFVDRVAK